jgi:exosome complex RNA-binding protein Rrp42 (RNase PH superfamily)
MQDVYCLDADGSLLDTALLASVAALAHCKSGCFVLLTDVL